MKPVVGKRLWADPMLSIIHVLTPAALGNGYQQCLQVPVVLAFKGQHFRKSVEGRLDTWGGEQQDIGRRQPSLRNCSGRSRRQHTVPDRARECVFRLSEPDRLCHNCSVLRL